MQTSVTAAKGLTTFRGGDYVAALMADLDSKAIAARIAQLRELRGFTQESLAKRLGVSKRAVETWETSTIPRPKNLNKLARVLETTPEYLLNGDPPVTGAQLSHLEQRIDDLVQEIRGEFEAIRVLLQARRR